MVNITPTQLEIIGYLINQENPQNIRGLARELNKSYALVYNNLEDLRKKYIISKQNIPPTQIISLNKNIPLDVLIEAEKKRTGKFIERKKWLQLFVKDILSSTESIFFVLLIFGSYAKNKQTKKSDLDLLVIIPKKEGIKVMETALKGSYTKIKKQIVIVDEKDFLEMIKKPTKFNVGNEAIKHHLILYGFEQYYQLLRKAEQ